METVPVVDVITFIFHSMDESYRPVTLRKTVLGYPCYNNGSEFKFDISLNYKLANVIQTYSENKPSLVVSGSLDASVVSIQRMCAAISFEKCNALLCYVVIWHRKIVLPVFSWARATNASIYSTVLLIALKK